MNSLSMLSLTAALLLSATPLALAQTNATGTVDTTVDGSIGGTDASGAVDTDAAVEVNVDENGIDLSLDANADGTVDASEQAAGEGSGTPGTSTGAGADVGGNTDTSVEGQTDTSLDTDGDGTVSPEETAAGEATMTNLDCSSVVTMVSAEDIIAIQSATSAQIVRLNDCEDDPASMNSEVESAVFGNAAIAAMLAAEGVGGGEMRGVTVSQTSLTIYVEDDMTNSGNADGSTVTP